MKDPVCGMEVQPQTAKAKTNYQGREHLFCSTNCKQKFDEHPEHYTEKTATQSKQGGGSAA